MGVAEIVIFAVCWFVVAIVMLWGVFTEHRRGSKARGEDWRPTVVTRSAPTDWIVLESTSGCTPEVELQARMIAAALLASRGIDMESLPAADLRTEVTSGGDDPGTTRVLVRAGAMHASRRHR